MMRKNHELKKKMQTGIREFCMINHQCEILKEEKKFKSQDLEQNKKAAQELLKEYISKDIDTKGNPKAQYLVSLGEDQFRLELQPAKKVQSAVSSSICDEILELWESRAQDIGFIFRSPNDEPSKALANFIEESLFASREVKHTSASIKLTKYKEHIRKL